MITTGELAAHTHSRGSMNITGQARIYSEYNLKNYDVVNVYKGAFVWTKAYEDNANMRYGTSTNMASGSNDTIRNVQFDASKSWTGATSSVGSGTAHNNLPAYNAVYCYQRLS